MIVISVSDDRVTVTGHAGYAPPGQDIVCAAVSALTFCLAHSLERLTPGKAEHNLTPGNASINITPTNETRLLLEAYHVGVTDLAGTYPKYITVEALTTVKQGEYSPTDNG